jgi:serine/threonine protein kinase, bacterial
LVCSRFSGVYVADPNKHRVLKLPAGSDTPATLPFTGLNDPYGVAVDSSGSVYVTDNTNQRVLKLPAGTTPTPFTGLSQPRGVGVDTAGNVYVTDARNHRVLKRRSAKGSCNPTRHRRLERSAFVADPVHHPGHREHGRNSRR